MNLSLLIPEFIAVGILIFMLLGELFIKDFSKNLAARTALSGCFMILGVLLIRSTIFHGYAFDGVFVVNSFTTFFKIFFVLSLIPVIQMSHEYFQDKLRSPGEFFLILWCTLIGLFFLASSNDFLLLFISLEIVTLSFYIMASYMKKDLLSIEAGLKYLIIGSLASAFLIYGVSLIYVLTGSTLLPTIQTFFSTNPMNAMMLLAVLLILTGIGFKISAVPFQLWVADVYEGAPAPVVAFLSVGSKAAGVLIGLKVFFEVFITFHVEREILFCVLAIMTILYGNLGALVQTNIKRLFAYSSISHAGYLLIGFAVGGRDGINAILYYLMAYGVSNLTAFLVICIACKHLKSNRIEDYRGLYKRSPLLTGAMFVALLSLAGIPPLAGFFGKFLILASAVKQGFTWVALIGALAVSISLFYYLSLIKKMYIDESVHDKEISVSQLSKGLFIILIILTIFMGIVQEPFYLFAEKATHSLLY